ncbi:MAG TPA: DUF2283 domain-containing protein [Planctomycetota bacterium]|nr:DUF2283 domain-containing protein [Planctomycetota bacterium]
MKVSYDAETDTLRIILRDIPVEESEEQKSGIVLDYDEKGEVIGIEVLQASRRVENPRSVNSVNVA